MSCYWCHVPFDHQRSIGCEKCAKRRALGTLVSKWNTEMPWPWWHIKRIPLNLLPTTPFCVPCFLYVIVPFRWRLIRALGSKISRHRSLRGIPVKYCTDVRPRDNDDNACILATNAVLIPRPPEKTNSTEWHTIIHLKQGTRKEHVQITLAIPKQWRPVILHPAASDQSGKFCLCFLEAPLAILFFPCLAAE